ATRAVFTRVGYHGLSVELVIAEAGLSRPTFYKYFRSTGEPIDLVLAGVNNQLIDAVLAAVDGPADPFGKVEAALMAWRHWGDALGPMLRPLFSELRDPHSPASRHRERTLEILANRCGDLFESLGRVRPSRLQIDALLNGAEYLGYRFHLESPRDEASWQATRAAMLRLALAMIGTAADWAMAVPLARALNVTLDPLPVNLEHPP
ncbi:MAG: TetR/AcrR family transcriptional regulator, partial [Actinomycetota bacterium]|nr:TetR/AcrR family transcriptional regulator [Actinomycetota bacterium]